MDGGKASKRLPLAPFEKSYAFCGGFESVFNAIRGLGFSQGKNMRKIAGKCNITIKSSQRSAFFGLLLGGGFSGGSAGRLVAGWLAGWPAGWLAGRRVGWLVSRQASKRLPLAHFE